MKEQSKVRKTKMLPMIGPSLRQIKPTWVETNSLKCLAKSLPIICQKLAIQRKITKIT